MAHDRLRQQIAFEAARRMYEHRESFHQAKLKAAQRFIHGWIHPRYLPTHREIRVELESFARIHEEHDERLLAGAAATDRFEIYAELLGPLEAVRQSAEHHPEGDALYHSLQVFELACAERPYDEEFLLAALLHDVGKALDAEDHTAAALAALTGWITPRTAWLIEHHGEGLACLAGALGTRARKRLEAAEHFDDLLLLAEMDRLGRRRGVRTRELEEALDYIAGLETEHDA